MTEDIEDVASGSFHHDKTSRALLIIGVCSIIIAIIITVGAIIFINKQNAWNPLSVYPTQLVRPNLVHLNETVNTIARKCAKENGVTVRFEGITWRAATNGIVVAESNSGEAHRFKSCGPDQNTSDYRFQNFIPQIVKDIVRTQGVSLWYITSVDIPIRGNGEEGVPRAWRTETFKLVP